MPTVCPGCVGRYNPNTNYPEPEVSYAGGGGLYACFEDVTNKQWSWTYRGWQARSGGSCPPSSTPPPNVAT